MQYLVSLIAAGQQPLGGLPHLGRLVRQQPVGDYLVHGHVQHRVERRSPDVDLPQVRLDSCAELGVLGLDQSDYPRVKQFLSVAEVRAGGVKNIHPDSLTARTCGTMGVIVRQLSERLRSLGQTDVLRRVAIVGAVASFIFLAYMTALSIWNVVAGSDAVVHDWRLSYFASVPLFGGLSISLASLLVASWSGPGSGRIMSLRQLVIALLTLETVVFLAFLIAAAIGAVVSSHDEYQIGVSGATPAEVVVGAVMAGVVGGAAARLVVQGRRPEKSVGVR